MSAKIAVSSSITWLSGWMRPASAGASRSGSVTSMVSDFSRASSAADFNRSRRAVSAWVTLSLARLIAAPCGLALVRRHLAERRQQRGDRALLAERRDAHGLQRGFVAGGGDLAEDFGFELGKVGHGRSLLTRVLKPLLPARHARACPGHPRLNVLVERKTWMAGTSPAMTPSRIARRGRRRRARELTPPARPWPSRRSPGTPPARGWRDPTAPCGPR